MDVRTARLELLKLLIPISSEKTPKEIHELIEQHVDFVFGGGRLICEKCK